MYSSLSSYLRHTSKKLQELAYVTRFAKTDQFPKIMQIELLVLLECAIIGQLNGGIGGAISGSTAKLQDALRLSLQKHCPETDVFLLSIDC